MKKALDILRIKNQHLKFDLEKATQSEKQLSDKKFYGN